MNYKKWLLSKSQPIKSSGFACPEELIPQASKPFQRSIISRALEQGKLCLWSGCGTGKTLMQLAWANAVASHACKPVLVLAPLAVSKQSVGEGKKFGIDVTLCESRQDVSDGVNITNYEKLQKFDPSSFFGVVLDESSILKSYDGKTRTAILNAFQDTPYRLACSATPAPNDFMELGNHAEFMGVMSREEMLAMYFVHDGGSTSQWRLKGHAQESFWEWVSSWAIMFDSPSEIGFESHGYTLPPLNINDVKVETPIPAPEGQLFYMPTNSLNDQRFVRKTSIEDRCRKAAEMVMDSDDQWVVWCQLNDESKLLASMIDDAVEIKGSDSNEHKSNSMLRFSSGDIRVLVTKPSIAGFGMNWQNCHKTIFVGASNSYEQFYQTIRRFYRFGQLHPVDVYRVIHEHEAPAIENLERKAKGAEKMKAKMLNQMHGKWGQLQQSKAKYNNTCEMLIPSWLKSEAA